MKYKQFIWREKKKTENKKKNNKTTSTICYDEKQNTVGKKNMV